MSKFSDWASEILSESNLPSDEFTWTTGDNYGLDGFQFDVSYGEGSEQAARLPEVKGLSGLPDGLVADEQMDDLSFFEDAEMQADEGGFDLGGMIDENDYFTDKEASPVVDLSWLHAEQDPDRLPEQPHDFVEDLEAQWKGARSFNLIPNVDKKVSEYEAWLKKPVVATGTRTAEEVKEAILRAIRRSHYGHDLNDIKAEVVATLGHDAIRTRSAMQVIESEHGLAGTVFVRASAFPGIKNGKWVDKLKRVARTARYVITDDQAVADKLGMQMVPQVPWDEALAFYAPKLKAAGYKVASKGDPKAVLQAAFFAGPQRAHVPEGHKPIEVKAADRVTSKAALEAFKKAPKVERQVMASPEVRHAEAKRQKALVQIAKWVRAGKLTQEDALRLRASSADYVDVMRTAEALVAAVGSKGVYDGMGKNATIARQSVWKTLEAKEAELQAGLRKKLSSYLGKAVKAGLLTVDESRRILAMDKPVHDLERIAAAAVQMAQQNRKVKRTATVPAKEYAGAKFEAAPMTRKAVEDFSAEDKRILAASKRSGIKATEFYSLVKWARKEMAEGWAGRDLDALLEARWSPSLLKAAKKLLRALRDEYEGLSGHLYVDAGAYASVNGTKGCDKGASRHRTNQIKFVMAMGRCAGCSFARALPDGTTKCSNYNKILIDEPPVENVKAYQKENIRLANASDSERTAALFDPGEYNLSSPLEDDLSLAESASVEQIGEVLFGGMQVE